MLRYNALVLLLGLPFLTRLVAFQSEGNEPGNFRVASFNTYALGAIADLNTNDEIDQYLDTADVSCAALIEWRFYKGKIDRKKFPFQVKLQHKQNFGNGILMVSRYPILHSGLVEFRSKSYNMAGFIDVETDNGIVRLYGLHLETTQLKPRHYHGLKNLEFDSTYAENAKNIVQRLKTSMQKRADQVEDIKEHMAQCPYPVIVMGDFNDGSQSYTYQQLKSGKQDAFVESGTGYESTFLRPFPLLRIDFILVDEAFTCRRYQSTDAIFSDHKLIFADITINNSNND